MTAMGWFLSQSRLETRTSQRRQKKAGLLVFKGRCSAEFIVTRNFHIGGIQKEKSEYGILQDEET
jgi:hypothetical protein